MAGVRPRHHPAGGITAGSTLVGVSAAFAGSCPADKMQADVRPQVNYAAKGVTDTTLAAIDWKGAGEHQGT